MFKNRETCNDICCSDYERRCNAKDYTRHPKTERAKYSKGETYEHHAIPYGRENDDCCSYTGSDFEDPLDRPKNRQCELGTQGKFRKKNADNGRSTVQNTMYDTTQGRNFERPSYFVECAPMFTSRSGKGYSKRDRAKRPETRSKHRSKSLGAKMDFTMPMADLYRNATRQRSRLEGSTKPRKTERRVSRRDVKKVDGVTEVTSLEIIKSWSQESLPPTVNRCKPKKRDKTIKWPSRKSTKVIFARYSQDSMDDGLSEKSTSLDEHDWSNEGMCVCDDEATCNPNGDYNIDDSSSECMNFIDESTMKRSYFDKSQPSDRNDFCICHECPMRERIVERKIVRSRRPSCDVGVGRRVKVARGSSLEVGAANRGTKSIATEKLIANVVRMNNKYSSRKSKLTTRKNSLRRNCVIREPNVRAQFSESEENFIGRDRKARDERENPRTRCIISKVVTKKSPKIHFGAEEQCGKLCKILNTRETGNAMNSSCTAAQLEDDHGCSVDCRCPESFSPICSESQLDMVECPVGRSPIGHRDSCRNPGKSSLKRFSGQEFCCTGVNDYSEANDVVGCEEIDDHSRLSRIGYVEEFEKDCDSKSGETLTGRNAHRQLRANLDEGDSTCCCAGRDFELQNHRKYKAKETPQCDDCLNLQDLRPEVSPPDHWTKYGDHLSRVTEEYRTLTSHLRDVQREAQIPEDSGCVRKRITRMYPSGKEFSFEVKTINDRFDDDGGSEKISGPSRDDSFCLCEEPPEDPATDWRETSDFTERTHRYSGREKATHHRSTGAMSIDDLPPCDCPSLTKKKKKRKRWKAMSYRTDLVKSLNSLSEKLEAVDREEELKMLKREKKKMRDRVNDARDCGCDEPEDRAEWSEETTREKYCDACVGTSSAGKFKRDTSENILMAPRIVKPGGDTKKANLKKILIYPPEGEDGTPLELMKDSSDIGCTVVSDVKNGYRYKVTYVQKFLSPPWCPIDDCYGGRDSDDYG